MLSFSYTGEQKKKGNYEKRIPLTQYLKENNPLLILQDKNNKNLVFILNSTIKNFKDLLGWGFPPPIEVWKIPIGAKGLEFDNATLQAEIPQVRKVINLNLKIAACIHEDTLYIVYQTSWSSGKHLSFKSIFLSGSPSLIYKSKEEKNKPEYKGFEVAKAVSLKYDSENREKRVRAPKPVCLYFDKQGKLYLLGSDADKRLFQAISKDKGKTWSLAKYVSSRDDKKGESSKE